MLRLIAATDQKNGIAKDGQMPWDIPDDLKYFKEQTYSHGGNVLMGRKTYQTFEHALENRTSYILTRQDLNNLPKSVHVIHDLNSFIKNLKQDLWVMGGAEVYQLTIPLASELYITKIDKDFNCDQFFPNYKDDFYLASNDGPHKHNGLSYSYQIYKRK